MKQTPAHDKFNENLLALLPSRMSRVVEVGCMRGSLAAEYLKSNPECSWIGIDIDPENVEIARRVCYRAICADAEEISDEGLNELFPADAWVFGDVLEHMRDPWQFLRRLRARMSDTGAVIACIPNVQHWSFQVLVNIGLFRYQDEGLFDRTHLRFFTRITILEMFESAGFQVESIISRNGWPPDAVKYIPHIRAMAEISGGNPDLAEKEAMAYQYVVKAVPRIS